VNRGLEISFAGGLRAAGTLRARPRLLAPGGGLTVLAVAPHPDDETIGCGGTLALHTRAGDRVHVLFVTDGRRSGALGLRPDEMARRRRLEGEAAAAALGASGTSWLELREGEWSDRELAERAAPVLTELAPAVVYAPSRVDFHPEHVAAARALAPLLTRLAPAARVRVYPIQVPLTRALTNLVAPVALEPLATALAAYETQAGSARHALRPRRYAAAAYGVPGLAEELWEMDVAAYARVHEKAGDGDAYRGLRPFAITDPLAYVRGFSARRELARCAR
jgi:LmbE family N-acetylglucosaminyl deacetylase